MTEDMYLRIKQVTAVTGLSRATIYNMMAVGEFPMKTALGVRAVGWLSSEIQNWMAERKLVEKRGVEAKPARRKPTNAGSASRRDFAVEEGRGDMPEIASVKQDGQPDWGQNDPVPTLAEQNATAERLRLINTTRGRNGAPAKVVSQRTTVLGHVNRSAFAGVSDDARKPTAEKAVIKRKT